MLPGERLQAFYALLPELNYEFVFVLMGVARYYGRSTED
jgi:hypothetical protein